MIEGLKSWGRSSFLKATNLTQRNTEYDCWEWSAEQKDTGGSRLDVRVISSRFVATHHGKSQQWR